MERIPNSVLGEICINSKEDYSLLLPEGLEDRFVASEFQKLIGRSSRFSYYAIKLLVSADVIRECGKRGRAVLYERVIKQ